MKIHVNLMTHLFLAFRNPDFQNSISIRCLCSRIIYRRRQWYSARELPVVSLHSMHVLVLLFARPLDFTAKMKMVVVNGDAYVFLLLQPWDLSSDNYLVLTLVNIDPYTRHISNQSSSNSRGNDPSSRLIMPNGSYGTRGMLTTPPGRNIRDYGSSEGKGICTCYGYIGLY